jgi:hypothetical protein
MNLQKHGAKMVNTRTLLKEVFTPGGQPSVTYVSRDHLRLEQRVKEAMARGYSINVVTGPTKSGKTVLCNHVLAQSGLSITIEGGQIRTEADFWNQIVHLLDLGRERSRSESSGNDGTVKSGVKIGLPSIAEVSGEIGTSQNRKTDRSVTYDINPQLSALNALVSENVALLVDDFHYIPVDAQKGIIQALKGAVFKGLSVLLLAVPHRAFDPMTVEQ